MALRPEVKALIDFLVEQWVTEVLDEAKAAQHRVIAESISQPSGSRPQHEPASVPAMLTTREAATYIRLSTSTLNQLRVKGGGPPFIKLGRRVTYRTAALDAWLAEREYPHTSAVDVENPRPREAETARRGRKTGRS